MIYYVHDTEYFEEKFKNLATKGDLKPISETLKRTTAMVANLTVDMKEVKSDMSTVKDSLNTHRNILDRIEKNTTDWKTETASMNAVIDRHKQWIEQIAEKVGIKLESK